MKRSGQTMLELVIAAGVISVSVIAALTLIIRTIDLARQSQQTVEAGNLAREGVEVVRMVRDSNWLDVDDNVQRCGVLTQWDSDGTSSGSCPPMSGQYIASFSPAAGWALSSCGGTCSATASQLIRTNGYFTQSLNVTPGGTATQYKRVITITPGTEQVQINPSGGETYTLSYLDVAVSVTWTNGTRRVNMHEKLYNWR